MNKIHTHRINLDFVDYPDFNIDGIALHNIKMDNANDYNVDISGTEEGIDLIIEMYSDGASPEYKEELKSTIQLISEHPIFIDHPSVGELRVRLCDEIYHGNDKEIKKINQSLISIGDNSHACSKCGVIVSQLIENKCGDCDAKERLKMLTTSQAQGTGNDLMKLIKHHLDSIGDLQDGEKIQIYNELNCSIKNEVVQIIDSFIMGN